MMMTTKGDRDRRREVRVVTGGEAVLHRGADRVRGRIDDVSMGSVRIELAGAVDALEAGAAVTVELHLEAAAPGWLQVSGRIERILATQAATQVVIAFDEVPVGLADLLEDELRATVESLRAPPVVIVDADESRRARLAGVMRDAGCRVVEAAAPLDAISSMQRSMTRAWMIVIADTFPERDAEQLREFFRDVHPQVDQASVGERGDGAAAVRRLHVDEVLDLGDQVARLIATRD